MQVQEEEKGKNKEKFGGKNGLLGNPQGSRDVFYRALQTPFSIHPAGVSCPSITELAKRAGSPFLFWVDGDRY